MNSNESDDSRPESDSVSEVAQLEASVSTVKKPGRPPGTRNRLPWPHKRCWEHGPPIQQQDGSWKDARGHYICGKKLRAHVPTNPTGICHNDHRRANGFCRKHGGSVAHGFGHPNFKHGRRVKVRMKPEERSRLLVDYLPDSLARHFRPDDPKLLELTDDLALVRGSIFEAGERLKAREPAAPRWRDLRAEWGRFKAARTSGNSKALQAAAEKLGALIETGALVQADRELLATLTDQRGRLVGVEARRRKDEQEMVDRAYFGRFAHALLGAMAGEIAAVVQAAAAAGTADAQALRVVELKARANIQEAFARLHALTQLPRVSDPESV